ncbi:MAG: flagellin [Terracidiphilus sp.]
MALGVLNNLSAIYAENNLNNTNSSLQTVLQQLSSGSRINSGSDDAAGLSLVNGLEANQTALMQSETNATEGVGLLQVADGALSQVTSLLDRAITLATEASNGTLNSTQEGAANQEYQSILSEVNNIGQTTTYNQQQVFNGQQVAIYTGDSSAAGSSLDDLNIRTLSEASVGDTGGKMAYSDGSNNVFINLSTATQNAEATDTLNINGTTTINVNYLVKGANGSESTATTSISVGEGSYDATTGSTYANTANGLIAAINAAGLGLSASFTTQTQAGVTGGGVQTGIEITGGLLSAGVDPGSASTGGVLNPSGIAAGELLTQGQTITVSVGGTTAATVAISPSISTLAELANAINHPVSPSVQNALVTATVVTNGDGSQSLALADTSSNGGALTVTTGGSEYSSNSLTAGSVSAAPVSLSFTNGADTAGRIGTDATATLGINGTNSSSSGLTGSIVLSNSATPGANPMTFIMGSGADVNGSGTFHVANYGNGSLNLGNLGLAIAANLGVTVSVGASGITMTSTGAGTTLEQVTGAGNNTLTAAPSLTVSNVEGWSAASVGTQATSTIAMNGDNGFNVGGTDSLSGNLVLQNGDLGNEGTPVTFSMGGAAGAGTIVVGGGGTGHATMLQLENAIVADGALGITGASVATGSLVLTSGSVGTTITPTSTLDYAPNLIKTGPNGPNAGALSTGAQVTTVGASTLSDILAGNLVLKNDGVTDTFTMGGPGGVGTIVVGTGGSGTATMNQLLNAINGGTLDPGLGITASLNPANGTIAFTSAISTSSTTPNIGVTSTLTDNYATEFTTPASGSPSQYQSGLLTLDDGGSMTTVAGALTGTLTISSNVGGAGPVITDTFVMGGVGGNDTQAGNTWNLSAADSTVQGLEDAINGSGGFAGVNTGAGNFGTASADLDINASTDLASGGIFIQAKSTTDTVLAAATTGLTDNVTEAGTSGGGGAATATANVLFGNAGTNGVNDPVLGTITLTNSGMGAATTFVMNGTAGHTTLGDLKTLIDNAGIGLNASIGSTGLLVSIAGNDFTDTLTATGSLTDSYGTLQTGSVGNPAVQAENASATVGTTGNIGASDVITGSILLQNSGGPGGTETFTMGTGANSGSNHFVGGTTIGDLAQAISDSALGISAIVNATTGALELQSGVANTNIVATSALADTVPEAVTFGNPDPGLSAQASTTTLTLASGSTNLQVGDVLTGDITIAANAGTETFAMGTTAHSGSGYGTLSGSVFTVNGDTVSDLEGAITNSGLGVSASNTGSNQNLVLTSNIDNATTISISNNSLNDAFSNPASQASLGVFANPLDQVSGTISFTVGSQPPESITIAPGSSVQDMVNKINGATDSHPYGITASLIPTGNGSFDTVMLTSDIYGPSGQIGSTSGTSIVDSTPTATLSYQGADGYNTGLSGGSIASNTAIYDSSSGQTNTLAGEAQIVSNSGASSGVATISYSDGAGEALNATDLTSQTDAETALNDLNVAISDVAAQDGYIGAQINTLNSISQVMSTQQENVVSAQNAIQATDYASATSNMSKYEILSQTGIAALAQANSVQQEVTKLLQ